MDDSIKNAHLTFPYSWVGHIPFVTELLPQLRPKVFVELGTHSGNSYLAVCQAIQTNHLDTQAFAVDTWQGDPHAEFYGDDVYETLNRYHQAHYSEFSKLLRMTFDEALAHFEDGSVDLLHIDGLHTYEAVKHDFESWLPKLSENAVVLFHDTCVKERDFGVWKLWEELQAQYPYTYNFTHSHGLGVLALSKPESEWLQQWLLPEADQQYQAALADQYEHMGDQLTFHANLKDLSQAVGDAMPAQRMAIQQIYDTHVHQYNLLSADYQAKASQIHSLEQLEEENHKLQQNVRELEATLDEVLHSISWRVTAPFRTVSSWKRALPVFSYVRRIRHFIRVYGLFGSAQKATSIFRAKGVKGLRQAFQGQPVGQAATAFEQHKSSRYSQRLTEQMDKRQQEANAWLEANRDEGGLPLISVVMPFYNPPPEVFEQAVNSVIDQSYPHWELCICNDASTDEAAVERLERFASEYPQIKVVHHQSNQHISAASNSALALATGEFVALMDHDDLLTPDALAWVAKEIQDHPGAKLLYSDEDKIDESGRFTDPYFKSDWNLEQFLSHNLICHLGVYSRELVERVGGFRTGYEGSQDYDLALRCLAEIDADQIRHLPKVLYHWRILEGSTALDQGQKPYTVQAAEKALNDFLHQKGWRGYIEQAEHGLYRWYPPVHQPEPSVSMVIPTKNGESLVRQCIDSIQNLTTYRNYEILLIDNASDDPDCLQYFKTLDEQANIRVIRDERPFNYSALNNAAVEHAKGEYVLLLNNDTQVIEPQWLTEMVTIAKREGVGAVGAKLLYPDDRIQHGGVIMGVGGVAGHAHHLLDRNALGYFGKAKTVQVVSAVTAACLLVKKSIFEEVGGLNETDLAIAFNDVDLCLKIMQKGYRNVWTPYALLYHYESVSRGYEDTPEKQARFAGEVAYMQKTWPQWIQNDPYYNPNLSLDHPYQLDQSLT